MAGNAPESTNQTTRMGVVNFEIGLQNNPTSKIPVSIYIYHATMENIHQSLGQDFEKMASDFSPEQNKTATPQ